MTRKITLKYIVFYTIRAYKVYCVNLHGYFVQNLVKIYKRFLINIFVRRLLDDLFGMTISQCLPLSFDEL